MPHPQPSSKLSGVIVLTVGALLFAWVWWGIRPNAPRTPHIAPSTSSVVPAVDTGPKDRVLTAEEQAAFGAYVLRAPESVRAEEGVTIRWRITSPEETKLITHTAIHYGEESRADTVFDETTTPQQSGYAFSTNKYTTGIPWGIPNTFEETINIPEGAETLYYRAHAIIDGKHYWSEEQKVSVEGGEGK